MNSCNAKCITALRHLGPNTLAQLVKWNVQLILQQRGTSACAAVADLSPVDEDAVDASPRQFVGQQRAGDTASYDQSVTMEILRKRRIHSDQPIPNWPERQPGGKIHFRVCGVLGNGRPT